MMDRVDLQHELHCAEAEIARLTVTLIRRTAERDQARSLAVRLEQELHQQQVGPR